MVPWQAGRILDVPPAVLMVTAILAPRCNLVTPVLDVSPWAGDFRTPAPVTVDRSELAGIRLTIPETLLATADEVIQ